MNHPRSPGASETSSQSTQQLSRLNMPTISTCGFFPTRVRCFPLPFLPAAPLPPVAGMPLMLLAVEEASSMENVVGSGKVLLRY